jgi:hypothetical protein
MSRDIGRFILKNIGLNLYNFTLLRFLYSQFEAVNFSHKQNDAET